MNKRILQPNYLILILVLGVAAFFRFYQIDRIPPGLFPDEATHALDAIEVLEGQFTLYSPDEGSTGSLWRYLLAIQFALFGPSILSLRIFAAVIGLLSVGMAYLLVRELALTPLGGSTEPVTTGGRPRLFWLWWPELIAGLSALLLAVSYWHVDLSRVGFSAVLMLLIQDATLFCLWRALASGHRGWFGLFGVGFGVLMYNYLPGKLVPVMLLLFFLLEWLIARRNALAVKQWRSLLAAAMLALLLALPLLFFAIFNYETLVARATVPGSGSIVPLSPWQGIAANLTAFGLWPTLWLAGRWNSLFLGPALTACFVVGIGVSLIRFKRPNYLFLLVWWLVMLLPGALAPEGAIPHTRRAIGTVTVTFALVSLGLATMLLALFWLVRRFAARTDTIRPVGGVPLLLTLVLGLALVAWTGANTFRRYFVIWGGSEEARLAFHVYDLELADLMARQSGPESVYLLPLDSTAGIVNPLLDTITFVYEGEAAYDFLSDDEKTMLARLSRLTQDRQIARLLSWKVTKHTGADPKQLAHYYLEKWGDWLSAESYSYFDLDSYQLYHSVDAFTPAVLTPTQIDFEGQMALTGYAFGPEYLPGDPPSGSRSPAVPAGRLLWTELNWRKTGQAPLDYQVGLWLEDFAGHVVGRVDSPLINNAGHRGTSAWPVGAEERTYHLLRIDPSTPPGPYRLKTVLYTAGETGGGGRRLAPTIPEVGTDLAVMLGTVMVELPLSPPDPAILTIPHRLDLDLGDGLHLLGFDPGFVGPLRPGDRATLSLWWRAGKTPSRNLAVAIGIEDESHAWSLSQPQPLGGPSYLTSNWKAGTVVRTFIDLRLPADVETGTYNLGGRLLTADSGESLADWLLGQVEVKGRPRNFDVPSMGHELQANFGDRINLLGYELDLADVQATGKVKLILYWQARMEMDTAYKVFVHLLDEGGQIVGQIDREPQAGEAPTTGWLEGEVVADDFDLPVDENLASVSRIAIGLYDSRNGKRLPVSGPSGQIEANQVIINLQ